SPQVIGNYSERELVKIIDTVADEVGLSPEQMNSSFHKSWKKVRDAPIFQLVVEQLFHYMTTYGYEVMGVFDHSTVFIPNEKLDVPELKDGIKLTVIQGYTKKQLKEKLLKIVNSGIALKSVDEVVDIAKYCKLTEDEVLEVNNKEVRARLYVELDLIPEDPTDLLRLALYETIEKTLLINNKGTIEQIKGSEKDITDLFEQYDEEFGYKRLAEIFQRFKPLFLAFKANESMISIINKIGHLSGKYHKTMRPSLLNDITGILKRHEKINPKKLDEELNRVNIFRKIRLGQSLSYRMTGCKSIMYKIRNGKAFATEMEFDNIAGATEVYNVILKSIAKDLKHLKGKEFYIPENLSYALPATEKQFTGNIPSGSYITVPKDMIFGIYWENVKGNRIDLDLSVMSLQHGKVGWDSSYRTDNRGILFSGDITDAPNGATELFYISDAYEDTVLLNLNYYNFDENIPVPFKIMIAEEHPNRFGKNYTIDPNHMKCIVKSEVNKKQNVIGLATVKDGKCRFYFSETALGDSISVCGGKYITLARDYLANFSTNQITLNEILEKVGATIVTEPTKKSIDLSLEALEKDTFINLLVQ
ncbi:hypothetical protein LCGC14_1755020, partial [marine sediment metagenome]